MYFFLLKQDSKMKMWRVIVPNMKRNTSVFLPAPTALKSQWNRPNNNKNNNNSKSSGLCSRLTIKHHHKVQIAHSLTQLRFFHRLVFVQ